MGNIGKIQPWALVCLFALSYTGENMYMAALPSMSEYFDIKGGFIQLSSTTYFLGFACGILSLGRISDLFGRRYVVLGGMTLYCCASLYSVFLEKVELLIVLRFVAAFGASVGSVIGQAMARDSYQGDKLSYLYASTSVWLALAPSVGSVFGGYILEYYGWRYVFLSLSLISFILLILYFKYLPETNPYLGKMSSQYFKIIRLVMKDRVVLLYSYIIGAFNGMMFGFCMEAPFIFIKKIGMTPSSYGKLAILLGISMAIGSFYSKILVKLNWNSMRIMKLGLILSLVASGFLMIICNINIVSFKLDYVAVAFIFIPMMVHMFGHGITMPVCLRHALEDYASVTGTAGSIFGFLYYILVAIISFFISRIHDHNTYGFTIIFFILSLGCYISYLIINKEKYRGL